MKRQSVIGPLILIAIGTLLLVRNLRPELPLLDLVMRYWPLLLVVWGVLRLGEILAAAARSHPLPRAGVSGGEWVLVVIICLVGTSAHFARSHWPETHITIRGLEVFGEAYDFPLVGEQPAGKAPHVFIENLEGNVRVFGSDTGTVKVEGRTTVRAFDREDAEQAHQKCPLELRVQADQITIRTNQDRASGAWKVSADLEVTVPKGASVECVGRFGDFDIANVAGDVDIKSDNAGVRLAGIGGNARVELQRSDIIRIVNLKGAADLKGRGQDVELEDIQGEVTINGSYSGELVMRNLARPLQFTSRRTEFRVEKTPGQIRMTLGELTANNLVGPIRLKTSSRDVEITGFTGRLNVEVDRGDVLLRPGGKSVSLIDVGLRSGDIQLDLPESAKFGLRAITNNGDIVNGFGPSLTLTAKGRKAILEGPKGVETTIRLKTGRGTITVRKASARPAGETQPAKLETKTARLVIEEY